MGLSMAESTANTRKSEIPASDLDDEADREELRDRYYGLLQELRVILPGVQVLVAFMLTAPFARRFSELGSTETALFGVALVSAILSVVSFITPIALHRLGPRTARGQRVRLSIASTQVGLLLLVISMLLSLTVVSGFLFSTIITGIVVAITATATITSWIVVPALLRRRELQLAEQTPDRAEQTTLDRTS